MRIKQRTTFFVKLAMLVFIVFALVTIIKLQFQYNELKDEKSILEVKQEELDLSIEEKQQALDKEYDNDYIEKIAREKLNYRYQNEIIYYNDLSK